MVRKKLTSEFKTRVALEAIKCLKPINEISSLYEFHPNQVSTWKNQFLEKAVDVFSKPDKSKEKQKEQETDNLYKKIGQLEVENEFLKKKWRQIQSK